MNYNILILGASYGSLLGCKFAAAGHPFMACAAKVWFSLTIHCLACRASANPHDNNSLIHTGPTQISNPRVDASNLAQA